MIGRCKNPSQSKYENYGGSGITYCTEWAVYSNFLRDMGERPEGKTLDRKDNSKGYYKENCRWATRWEQDTNKGPRSGNISKKTGVNFNKNLRRWIARIRLKDGSDMYLGCFKEEDSAIAARVAAEDKYWKEIASEERLL